MMKLDKETLKQWKEDAINATEGVWRTISDGDGVGSLDSEGNDCKIIFYNRESTQDSMHIANSCPQNFIALIEKLEKYEEALKFYADKENYIHYSDESWLNAGAPSKWIGLLEEDKGFLARKVLEEVNADNLK